MVIDASGDPYWHDVSDAVPPLNVMVFAIRRTGRAMFVRRKSGGWYSEVTGEQIYDIDRWFPLCRTKEESNGH